VERVVRSQADIPVAFASVAPGDVQGVMMISNRLLQFASTIVRAALENGLPLGASTRRLAMEGALFSYAPDLGDTGKAGARHVDRILKGTKPADLPVEQPMRFEFVVNLKTARELGLTFSPEIQLQITEVVE
jgi:putative ABC transport system substrate-binding protein